MINAIMVSYHYYFQTNVEKLIFPVFLIGCGFIILPIIYDSNVDTYLNQYDGIQYALELKQSMYIHMALASTLSCMIPFIFDFLFNLFYIYLFLQNYNNNHCDKFMSPLHINIVLFLVALPSAYMLFVAIPYEQIDIMHNIFNLRDVLLTLYFLKHLTNYGHPVWNVWSYVFIGIPSVLCNLIITYDIESENYHLTNGLNFLICISIIVIIINIIQIIMSSIDKLKNNSSNNNNNDNSSSLHDDIVCTTYTIFFSIFYISHWSIYLTPTSLHYFMHARRYMSINFLTVYSCFITLCFSIIYCIAYQLQRLESYETKV
jgi:hypothetical protein